MFGVNAFKKYDNAKLIIKDNPKVYGQSNVLQEIIKMQYKTGCAEIIYLDQDLSDEEMSNVFKASSVVVHPYRAEGFGMHIQEAVACGCLPMVSANGPTDDFIPNDIGIKLQVTLKPVNITRSCYICYETWRFCYFNELSYFCK
jgi:glycosyltransferase involved in cell wall biosynthesis